MQTLLYRWIYCATLSRTPIASFGLVALVGFGFNHLAQAQSSCSSDGQRAPTAVLERFISADCDTCWAQASLPQASRGQVALDWIVPSAQGDDAALSGAASRDAQARLIALGLPWNPAKAGLQSSAVQKTAPYPTAKAAAKLRVAHGLPFNGYIGASIQFTPSQATGAARQPARPAQGHELFAHLVLVETLPSGTEGSNVERNLVRNVLITPWRMADELDKVNKEGFKPFFESRPISIPAGVNPERLRVLGWVQDAGGKVIATALSRCQE